MLIYTCEGDEGQIPVPPPSAMEQVKTLNASHDQACEAFQVKYVVQHLIDNSIP